MRDKVDKLLASGRADVFKITRGIEKESLRVLASGQVSHAPHPHALGSTLTHPMITTDFAESLLELVTAPHSSFEGVLTQLENIHRCVVAHLGEEFLWPGSMPGLLNDLDDLPIADYGSSHNGQMKHLYRKGLVIRYGKAMQMIAGVHYNVSFSEALFTVLGAYTQHDISEVYMGCVRNFFRHYWMIPYLFGTTPAVMSTSLPEHLPDFLSPLDDLTYIGPASTSLRMSDLGYQNTIQDSLAISYNSLSEYAKGLCAATRTPYAPFTALGVKGPEGFRQLNDSILQIENEYYSPIRPKQIAHRGEKPSVALKKRGVAYIEVRALDVDPFSPLGITRETMAFMDVLLMTCLLQASPDLNDDEMQQCKHVFDDVVCFGRDQELSEKAAPMLGAMAEVARAMDQGSEEAVYLSAVEHAERLFEHPMQIPSARLEGLIREEGYVPLMMRLAQAHKVSFSQGEVPASFSVLAEQSHQAQRELEQQSTGSFDDCLKDYLAS